MTSIQQQLLLKMEAITAELRLIEVYPPEIPSWVYSYDDGRDLLNMSFVEWMQFIYLPNCMQNRRHSNPIVPQALTYAAEDLKKGRLLQLLIELDGLV